MKNQFLLGAIALGAMTIGSVMTAPDASAMTFSFGNIAGGDTVGDGIVNQFSFDVDDLGSGGVQFTVKNAGTLFNGAFIREIYFDTGTTGSALGTFDGFVLSSGVNYESGATPSNLPQGNNIAFTSNFGVDPISLDGKGQGQGANSGGIDAGQSLGIKFKGASYSDIIASLLSAPSPNNLRLGIHVAGVNVKGDSDAYVSSKCTSCQTPEPPKEVPTPAAVLPVLGGLLRAASRRKQDESTEA